VSIEARGSEHERPWALVASAGMPQLCAVGVRRQLVPGTWIGLELGSLMGIVFSGALDLTTDFLTLAQAHFQFGLVGSVLWTHGCAWGGCGREGFMGGGGLQVGAEWRSRFGLTVGGDIGVMAGRWDSGDPRDGLWMPRFTVLRVGYRPRWGSHHLDP